MINNLDEAIKHFEEKANENNAEATKIAREKKPFLEYASCKQCAKDHEQLASWLKELKAYKERPKGEWKVYARQGGIPISDYCSNCKYEMRWYKNKYKFCPNCGADMRGEKE